MSQLNQNRDRPVIHVYDVNANTAIGSSLSKKRIVQRKIKNVSFKGDRCSFSTGSVMAGDYSLWITASNGKRMHIKDLKLNAYTHYSVKFRKFRNTMSAKGLYFIELKNVNNSGIYREKMFKL